jgi:hypothetical protein
MKKYGAVRIPRFALPDPLPTIDNRKDIVHLMDVHHVPDDVPEGTPARRVMVFCRMVPDWDGLREVLWLRNPTDEMPIIQRWGIRLSDLETHSNAEQEGKGGDRK